MSTIEFFAANPKFFDLFMFVSMTCIAICAGTLLHWITKPIEDYYSERTAARRERRRIIRQARRI